MSSSIVYRLLVWVGILISIQTLAQNDINFFRVNFENAKGEVDFQKMIDADIDDTLGFNINVINSYKAVCISAMAQYVFNPYTKYQLFNTGKDELEKCITQEASVENIFLRLVIQLSIPRFLGYHDEILNDLAYLNENLPIANVPVETKQFIIRTIQETGNEDYDLDALAQLNLSPLTSTH